MARCSMLLVLLVAGPAAAHASVRGGRAFLGEKMQPEVVAHTLKGVEEEWKAQVALFAQCSTSADQGSSLVNCADAPTSFAKSCSTVVGAVIQGSNGDKNVAKEYMTDVCSQSSMKGWQQQKCQGLAVAISGAMSADTYQNRYSFDSAKLCTGFWSQFLTEEQQHMADEKAEQDAEQKKAAEEDKAAEEAEAKRVVAEAARLKVEQAAQKNQEAQTKAAEAAAKVVQKKAEAEAVAKAAEQKVLEAARAERENEEAKKVVSEAKPAAAKAEVAAKPVEVATPLEVKAVAVVAEASQRVAPKAESATEPAKAVPAVAAKPVEAVAAPKK